MNYSIEIYKSDKRLKAGKKLVEVVEIEVENREEAVAFAENKMDGKGDKFSYEIHETYRMVRNIMSGRMVKEHYKTPYSCSVASESYFSN